MSVLPEALSRRSRTSLIFDGNCSWSFFSQLSGFISKSTPTIMMVSPFVRKSYEHSSTVPENIDPWAFQLNTCWTSGEVENVLGSLHALRLYLFIYFSKIKVVKPWLIMSHNAAHDIKICFICTRSSVENQVELTLDQHPTFWTPIFRKPFFMPASAITHCWCLMSDC